MTSRSPRATRWLPVLVVALTGCSGAAAEHHRHGEHRHAHHHHNHRFQDPEKWAKVFDDPARDKWQKPDQVVQKLAIEPAMKVAEIGSGTGYFVVRMARAVPRGKAYGVDIEQGMVDYLAKRARKEQLPQLVSVLGASDDPRIPEPVDLVFLCNTYHHIGERPAYFRRLKQSLSPGGRLAIVDFKKERTPVGPALEMRLSPAELDSELARAGYRRVSLDAKTLPYQYIALYRPTE